MNTPPNIFDTSAGAYNSGVAAMDYTVNPFSVNATMNQFMNPYINRVIDTSLDRLGEQRDIGLNDIRGRAAAAGAYGGNRAQLAEADWRDSITQQANETVSRLLQQGYDLSAGYGLQRLDQISNTGAQLVNAAPTGYNLGQNAMNQQFAMGSQQQRLAQSVLDQAGMQTENFLNYPQQSLNTALAGVAGNPLQGNSTQTSSYNPGMFDYLQLGAGLMGARK